ncbi:MAG: T9SS type A sorting domain-containing protein [Bacteroidota bacterium]|nr:T9SS type A sorting domain-containing protein [Bacteroidota bacterium]
MKTISITFLIAGMLAFGFVGLSQPIAVNDNYSPVIQPYQTDSFNVVGNDSDPGGDPFKICEVIQLRNNIEHSFFNDTCIWSMMVATYEIVFKYRLCRINDTTIVSNWAYLAINPTYNIHYPVAINDTSVISPGETIYVDILANDFDPDGDSIYIKSTLMGFAGQALAVQPEIIGDSVKLTLSLNDYRVINKGNLEYRYTISDTLPVTNSTGDMGLIYIKVENGNYYDYLDINNINARFSCMGNHFWDLVGISEFFYPNGSTKTACFANATWIGGKTFGSDTVLHIAAENFRLSGGDFWPGPISDSYDLAYDQKWFHAWKLSKSEISYHKQNWWQPGYTPIENILTWPGNGDVSLGQAAELAPFHDSDNDGIYEPLQGEYPYIRGDQAIFFIFNDDRHEHYETQGAKLGIEIQGMAYAFDEPQNAALWNTVFLHYDIINRSDTTYYDTYLGNWTDTDLGDGCDDYIGCNVEESFYYSYNGKAIDGIGELYAYGANPPMFAMKILAGPLMDADNIDNPSGVCDESVNGSFFGDSIIDNERLGMTGFRYYYNAASCPTINPQNAKDYYNYLSGKWLDNTPLMYGGNGHYTDPDATIYPTKFMFPGETDSCGWGQGGIILPAWDEASSNNQPGDRRGVGISGPFTFGAGETQSVDYAYIMAQGDSSDYLSAFDTLNVYSQYLSNLFEGNSPIFNSIAKLPSALPQINVYPNPTAGFITIDARNSDNEFTFYLFDIAGKLQRKGKIYKATSKQLDISNLAAGVYFLRLSAKEGTKTFKIIKK